MKPVENITETIEMIKKRGKIAEGGLILMDSCAEDINEFLRLKDIMKHAYWLKVGTGTGEYKTPRFEDFKFAAEKIKEIFDHEIEIRKKKMMDIPENTMKRIEEFDKEMKGEIETTDESN